MRKFIAFAIWTTVTLAVVLAFIAYDTPYDDTHTSILRNAGG